jgi:asparagine synthase (glutamine-hydrolysing)
MIFLHDDVWIVADTILGDGEHDVRLQWLGGAFPHEARDGGLRLLTPAGPFDVQCRFVDGHPLSGSVVAGGEDPPRGWISRYYGEKVPAPSLVVDICGSLPMTLLSILSAGDVGVHVSGEDWTVDHSRGKIRFVCRPAGLEIRGVDARP